MNIPLKQSKELLANYLRPYRHKVVLLACLLFAHVALQLASPQILRDFIDGATAGHAVEALASPALLFLAVALAGQGLSVASAYVSQEVGWNATNALRTDLAEHCLSLDMPFHKARTPGELIERIDGDVSVLANFFSQFVLLVLANALLLAGVLVVLWREDWRIGLALSIYTGTVLAGLIRSRGFAVPHNIAMRKAHAKLFGFLEERLAGLDDIRANGAGPYVTRQFDELQADVFDKVRRSELAHMLVDIVSTGLFTVGFVGALALGAWQYGAGLMTVGGVFMILRYTQMLRGPIQQITRQMQDFQRAAAGIVRAGELLAMERQVRDGPGVLFGAGAAAVEFDHVSFEYRDERAGRDGNPDRPENGNGSAVLHDLSFRLERGTILGLLGRTGSGKTTVTRLLARLHDPSAGCIYVEGTDIRTARLSELRRLVGMVTQDVHLFSASLRDNLTLFEENVDDSRILAALDELGLMPWYGTLPDGLDTELTSGGGLSAGEAQLLAFARVWLKDPALVILDEASSRLDPATERLIERAVDRLLRGRTAIIIAHRLETVQRADAIIILEDGRIREHGRRESLAADPGSRFYHLMQTGLEEVLV